VVVVVVVVVAVAEGERRQTRRFPVFVHRKEPAVVLRIWPTLLHAVPPIDVGWIALCETAVRLGATTSGSGVAIGRMPVRAAAPTEIVWHTMHICTANGTYE